jgi:hypothetical protein
LKGHQELADELLRGDQHEDVLDQPVIVGVRPDAARSYGSVRRLKIFGTRKLTNGSAQMRSVPCTRCSVVVAQTGQLLVVIDVQERLPRALLDLPGEVGDEIVTVQNEVHGSIRAAHLVIDDWKAPDSPGAHERISVKRAG